MSSDCFMCSVSYINFSWYCIQTLFCAEVNFSALISFIDVENKFDAALTVSALLLTKAFFTSRYLLINDCKELVESFCALLFWTSAVVNKISMKINVLIFYWLLIFIRYYLNYLPTNSSD